MIINPYAFGASAPGGAGLALWLAAWKETGFSDNDAMATVTDFSGNGRHFTQSTSGRRPLYKTNTLNSQPSIRFDGSDDYVEATAFMSGTEAELFAVMLIPSGIGASNWGWQKFSGATLADHLTFFGAGYSTFGGTNRTNYTINSAVYEAGWILHILAKGGTNGWKWYENGNVEKATMTQTMDWGTSRHMVGASSTNANGSGQAAYFNGHLLEMQIYIGERSAGERNAVLADFNTRYGISYTSF